MSKTIKPVLIMMTSHATKGDSGQPTGFYLSEVTHPLAVLEAAGVLGNLFRGRSRRHVRLPAMRRGECQDSRRLESQPGW